MQKIVSLTCPKCNNNHSFYRYGKDKYGYQKYLCRKCNHQFAPNKPASEKSNQTKYPRCPKCNKASFLHHDYEFYSNYRCCYKKCNHSFFFAKQNTIPKTSASNLLGKNNFKRMRYPIHTILNALIMFYIGKNSFRNIALIFKTSFNITVSHTTISNWCKQFAPLFDNIKKKLLPNLNLNSDEWHIDETVVKIAGIKYYIWFIIDAETRFVIDFHLSPFRNATQAFCLLNSAKKTGLPISIVSDRYAAYNIPVKSVMPNAKHIKVQSFKDDISNNLIESFHHQFKAWYKTKQGFNSFDSANNLLAMFVFFFNFVRPHSALQKNTPAQVAGLSLSKKQKRSYLIVA